MTKQPPMRFTFIILSLFVIPILGYSQTTTPDPAPNFTVMSSPTVSHRLYEDFLIQGKTVVLELFFVDCPPCNDFAPFMSGLYDEWGHGEEDVAFIGLDIEDTDSFMDVANFQMRHGHDWLAISQEGESIEASEVYRDGTYGEYLGTPTIIVIAPDGTVNYRPNGTNLDSLGYMQLDSAIAATGARHYISFNNVPMPIADLTCDYNNLPLSEDVWATGIGTGNCGPFPTISSIDPFEEDLCNGYTITYRWTSNGVCGYPREITEPLRVLPDTEPPTFDQTPPASLPTIREGDPYPPQNSLTASDNCSSAIVTQHIDTLNFSCCEAYTIAYRWVATDECGNSAEESVRFAVRPSTAPPSFVQDPLPIADIGCLDDLPVQETLMVAGGECGGTEVVASIDDYVVDPCNGYTITYRWTITDPCGRTAEKTIDFNVLPDTDGPVFDREPMPIASINCNEPLPIQETLTARDFCVGAAIVVASSVDEHTDLCNGLVTINYRWSATDNCGNTTEKVVSFDVLDTTMTELPPSVIDRIQTQDREQIAFVDLVFSGGMDTIITTSSTGEFLTQDLIANGPFVITPEKNSSISNGLTTFDLVLITRHILGIEPFSSNTQSIAADANQSNSVTTFDVVLLQQIILGLETTLPAGSWRFIPESIEFNTLVDLRDFGFLGVKIGDVNSSADPNAFFDTSEPRSYPYTVALAVEDQAVEVGDLISIPFSLKDNDPLLGFQFTLDFDAASLQYQGIEDIALPNFEATNINTLQKDRGQLAFSWFDINEGASNDLFTLEFKVTREGQLSDFIDLSSTLTMAEAYLAETEETVNIALDFNKSIPLTNSKLLLTPNPTGKGITNLEMEVSAPQTLSIQIFSTNGHLMTHMSYEANTPGLQQISLPTASLPTGVYFVSVEEKDSTTRYAKLMKK